MLRRALEQERGEHQSLTFTVSTQKTSDNLSRYLKERTLLNLSILQPIQFNFPPIRVSMADDHEEQLVPPARTSIDDPGAHDLGRYSIHHVKQPYSCSHTESSDSEDHFSDAQSGLDPTESVSVDSSSVAVPHTRLEKVDDKPSYGEEPGTEAYRMREQDATPDEVAIVPDRKSPEIGAASSKPSTPPGGQPIPLMVVEKLDPSTPSHGEIPGTLAHDMRAADAVPDLVIRSGSGERSRSSSVRSRANSTPGDLPIPITKVEKIDSSPSHGEVPGTKAYELRRGDAEPDIVEEVGEVPGKCISIACTSERLTGSGSPTSPAARSPIINHARRKSSAAGRKGTYVAADEYNEAEDGSDGGFGDDFDDFEEGEDAEFGDFDDGFQEAAPAPPPPQSIPVTPSFVSSKLYNLETTTWSWNVVMLADPFPARP